MTSVPRQLVFELPHRAALEAEDFLVSSSNAAAVELIDAWPNWSHWAAIVEGPSGSGKSHLANVWRLRSSAGRADAARFSDADVAELAARGALLIEDLHAGTGNEQAFFHALNLAREMKYSILITSRVAAGDLDVTLPDLRSRLRALPRVAILAPDDGLLQAVLVKLFADRQLEVDPAVVSYLCRHMERSFAAASRTVAEIDRLALAMRRKVTRTVAAEALRALGSAEQATAGLSSADPGGRPNS